jgi:hypothetical protein
MRGHPVTPAVLLAAHAAAAGLLAPAALRRGWAARSPRLAMSVWLVLPVSWMVAVVLAVLAATAPLARALVVLARAGTRPAALAAGGSAAIARVRRLLAPPQQRLARRACLAATAGLLLPAAVACLPVIIAACDVTAHP